MLKLGDKSYFLVSNLLRKVVEYKKIELGSTKLLIVD